jgi:hypothetical protein
LFISFVIQRQRTDEKNPIEKERLFTPEQLQLYTKDELYLAILGKNKYYDLYGKFIIINIGHVFNVSSAPRFYSSTGSYKFYTGKLNKNANQSKLN